jgi:hypothetical protein
LERWGVEYVALDNFDVSVERREIFMQTAGKVVEDRDAIPRANEVVDHVRTDEPGPAGHEN